MSKTDANLTFFVTGAAKRVGAAITRALHATGANVIVHCNRSRDDADILARELNNARPNSAAILQGDLLAYNALKGLIDQAASVFGRPRHSARKSSRRGR